MTISKRFLLWLLLSLLVLAVGGCRQAPEDTGPEPGAWSASLAFDRAAAGDLMTVLTPNGGAAATTVVVGGTQLTVLQPAADDRSLTFTVPAGLSGTTTVKLGHEGESSEHELVILPAADVSQLLLVVDPDLTLSALNAILANYGVPPVAEPLRQLYGPNSYGECLGQLALIDLPEGHPSVGELLAELAREEQIWAADPKSEWGLSSASQLELSGQVGLRQTHPALTGSGVTIAVLDTGVAAVTELGARLLTQIDVLDENETGDPYLDASGNATGHGTAVATLAAGTTLGVAPGAAVLPVRVCDADGLCLASDVLLGVCRALSQVNPADGLVINLSLGGDSEVRVLSRLLESATSRGAVVVAAGGNSDSAPPHWPAAGSPGNPGLLAVGALQVTGVEADIGALLADVYFELQVPGVAALEVLDSRGNGYLSVRDDPLAAIEIYDAEVGFTLSAEADALRLVLELTSTAVTGFELLLDGTSLSIGDVADLRLTPMLQDGYLIQSLGAETDPWVELLIDPIPAEFSLLSPGTLRMLELELVQVTGAPGGYTSGDYLSLAAPAVNLTASDPAGAASAAFTGTSFATPQVAGAAALQLQLQRSLGSGDAGAVAQALLEGSRPVAVPAELAGAGRLDLRYLIGGPGLP